MKNNVKKTVNVIDQIRFMRFLREITGRPEFHLTGNLNRTGNFD